MFENIRDIDSDVLQLITVWLSGVLAGEIFIVVAIGQFRPIKRALSTTDQLTALVLAILAIGILVVVMYTELRSE